MKERRDDGTVILLTRRGKEHCVPTDSPNLRHARWWERLLYGNRFPKFRELKGTVPEDQHAGLRAT